MGSPLPTGPLGDLDTAGLSEPEKDSMVGVTGMLLESHSRLDAQQKYLDELKATRERVREGTSTSSAHRDCAGSSRGHSCYRADPAHASKLLESPIVEDYIRRSL